ncbi:MAG: SusC/RagA family TonB-linked outer membrane protein [Puia sp.]|nr:SusC/RagA family TonB-linked outer membrane protein [Puia sp.]
MRLTAFFMFLACMEVQAHGHAQERLTISEKDAPLPSIFKAIERQSDFHFFYDFPLLQKAGKVSVEVKDASLEEVLGMIFKNQPFDYEIVGKVVTVREKQENTPAGVPDRGPKLIGELTGRVTDESGTPLQGATVAINNSKKGTFTDEKGMFLLKDVPVDAVLGVTFTGYQAKEVPVSEKGPVAVVLKVATNELDRVKVVAYGITTQRLNTGNVSTITSKEMSEQPVANPLASMEGRIPGMFITQNTGVPGSSFSVQIRGLNSIANGNDPLYVIDGVPYTSELLTNSNTAAHSGSPLNFINISDIERIDVLKDADATAIYGTRAANGVVLITTKKGKAGTSNVDINVYTGAGKVSRYLDLLNRQQYLEMRREAFKNDGVTPTLTNAPDLLLWDTTRSTDWQKTLIGGAAHYTDAQASVSGGNANTQYMLGGGYHRETTVFPGDFADQKASVHFNISSVSTNQKFKAQLSGTYVSDNTNLPSLDLIGKATGLAPDAPAIYNTDGTLNWEPRKAGAVGTWTNPIATVKQTYKGQTGNLISNGLLSYSILPGLEIKTSLGYTNMQVNELSERPLSSFDPGSHLPSGRSTFNIYSIRSWVAEPQISYQRRLWNGNLSALAGTTFQQNSYVGQMTNASNFSNDALLGNMQAAATLAVASVTDNQYNYNSGFGRINYNYDDRYIINVTGRRDGSSRFGPGKQFANFGAAGAAWIFSNETAIKNSLPFLSHGKIRSSYGTTGNDQIGDYQFLSLYSSTYNPYQNTQGLYPTNIYNQNFAWEVTKKLEGGIDFGFIKDRILFSASYYRNRSSNQLLNAPLSSVTGFGSILENLAATVENTGWEMVLNTINIRSNTLSWKSSFNIAIPRNKLVAFPGLATSAYYSSTYVIGQPINVVKAYHLIGVNDSTGKFQFATGKSGATYTPSAETDRTSLINVNPSYYGGFLNSFSYKGFSLDVFFYFVKQTGTKFLWTTFPGYLGYNQPTTVLNRWQKTGDAASTQRFTQGYGLYNSFLDAVASDYAYTDASYIRLKNLSLSYSIPESWRRSLHLLACRFYIQGQNLFTITKFKSSDPENQGGGASLPPLRVITGGFQLTL